MPIDEDAEPESLGRGMKVLLAIVVVVGLAIPVVFFQATFNNAPVIGPRDARAMLAAKETPTVLVDIRTPEAFAERHIDGAINWPIEAILQVKSAGDVSSPESLRGKRLLLICPTGYSSAKAARHLESVGLANVWSVRGGEQDWVAGANISAGGPYERFRFASGEVKPLPYRESPAFEQFVLVLSGFGMKPAYTLLSLILAIVLWRSKAVDLTALRRGMIFFFLGENACATNYFLFKDESFLLEYLHSTGMLFAFGLVSYAIIEGMDRRILMLSDPHRKCASLQLCGGCIKYANAPCGLKRTFFVIIPAVMVLSAMPLCADFNLNSYNTTIYGTVYNYSHRLAYQLYETRFCPAAAIVLLIGSLGVLLFKKRDPLTLAKVLFAAGLGPMGFGFLRMILVHAYADNMVYSDFWEEASEFLFVAGVCAVLWIFRHGLFGKPAASIGGTVVS